MLAPLHPRPRAGGPGGVALGSLPAIWSSASAQGPRRHLADAAAGHRSAVTSRVAVAVADGVGDSGSARHAAALVADHAVRVATSEPARGATDTDAVVTAITASRDLLVSAGVHATGDAALVVALGPRPGERWWTVAWVGDCRAYRRDGAVLRQITRDHTVGAHLRGFGIAARPALDHVLTTSVRTVGKGEVGVVTVAAPDGLLLVTDGVHRSVPAAQLAAVTGAEAPVEARTAWLLDAAARAGTSDNATALVVDAVGIPAPRLPLPR